MLNFKFFAFDTVVSDGTVELSGSFTSTALTLRFLNQRNANVVFLFVKF